MNTTTTNRKSYAIGTFFLICLTISLVCLVVAIMRGDEQGAALIFISVGLSGRSAALWLDKNL